MIDPWQLLDLPRDATARDVKRRYAQLLKVNRPDDDPSGFSRLRWAYEVCLAQASTAGAAVAVGIGDEPATAPELGPAGEPGPAPRPKVTLRPVVVPYDETPLEAPPRPRAPAEVVAELYAQARPDAAPGAFAAWFAQCPEFVNFSARDAVERALLERLADDDCAIAYEALRFLEEEFRWREHEFPRRLMTNGASAADVRRYFDAIGRCFTLGQFDWHIRHGETLADTSIDPPPTLASERRRLRYLRNRWSRLTALAPWSLRTTSALLAGYAKHYSHRALYAAYGEDTLKFWQSLQPTADPNIRQLAVWWARAFIVVAVLQTLLGLFNAIDGMPLREIVTGRLSGFAAGCIVAAPLTFGVWLAYSGSMLAAWAAQWRERTLPRIEPWLRWPRALPILGVFVGASLAAGMTGRAWPVACVALGCAAVFGSWAFVGALAFAAFSILSLHQYVPLAGSVATAGALAAPLVAVWFADRMAVVLLRRNPSLDGEGRAEQRRRKTGAIICFGGLAILLAASLLHG